MGVKVVVKVQKSVGGTNFGLSRGLDDLLGKSLLLWIVAAELDPKTGIEKPSIRIFANRGRDVDGEKQYEANFVFPEDFGDVGAILVENEHKEMYVKNIVIDGSPHGKINITCNSWVHTKFEKRIFFTNKSYIPSQTPSGVKRLRERELVTLRGDGFGERKKYERIYDYDVYNDIGDPNVNDNGKRPVLGGKQLPYPRRCRTGRSRSKKDPLSELKSDFVYVPRDEEFSEVKSSTFSGNPIYSVLQAVVPALETIVSNPDLDFPQFPSIGSLFNVGIDVSRQGNKKNGMFNVVQRLIKAISDTETPQSLQRDKFSWLGDVEFARQTLSGFNPYSIRLVTEWPLKSKLSPEVYGPPESAMTKELIELEIGGSMTVEEAVQQKKLFILDYHDLLLPYVNKVNELKRTVLYGSRTLFFLTHEGTLRPLAIELTRPPIDNKPQWKQAYFPSTWNATGAWLWKLAKTHVLAHDSGYHQLVSHWLRTHCATEPYIIATNRQLSAMHPIYRLLHPHFRHTMKINSLAREALINANGIIETSFSLGKYAMEFSSVAYDLEWRFDQEALPQNLISRGLAVEDPNEPYGLKLTIQDYPFANDGLVLWDTLKQWVTNYVNHYYPQTNLIESDKEIQAWWSEIKNIGHGDKKNEPWWPELKTPNDLIGIITTMIWVTSGHHAAVNFGQYIYAVQQKKLFILDYHDLLLPYVNKVNELKRTVLYGSRTLFFLTHEGTLRPLAIELTRPPIDNKPQWKQAYFPSTWNATGAWLWKLAKTHVLAHDSGYHQLVSHWLRTHCATEPYIIATNRQLSAMHPIYRLLHPHFRHTMKINSLAREALINANGIIETSFSLGKYAMEFSSVAYDLEWRFDQEALPQNLISRGLAVEDPNEPYGLKLTIQDYPFANDGLVLWDTLKQWVTNYVNHYYPQTNLIESDKEIQAWWSEIKNIGHGDKKNEPWWPELKTPNDLIGIITTMIWVTSGHHAAVNFGQYIYAGYFPNRPTIARTKMPTEDPTNEEWESFLNKPEEALLKCLPSQLQATKLIAIMDVLSNHAPDEEYIGEIIEPHWAEDPVINAAFEVFSGKLKEFEGIIDARNVDSKLMNRNGAGVMPYELLKPFSEPGVTGKGVPYSISI